MGVRTFGEAVLSERSSEISSPDPLTMKLAAAELVLPQGTLEGAPGAFIVEYCFLECMDE